MDSHASAGDRGVTRVSLFRSLRLFTLVRYFARTAAIGDAVKIMRRQRSMQCERLHVSLLIFPAHRDYWYLPVPFGVIEFSRALTRPFRTARTENALRRSMIDNDVARAILSVERWCQKSDDKPVERFEMPEELRGIKNKNVY